MEHGASKLCIDEFVNYLLILFIYFIYSFIHLFIYWWARTFFLGCFPLVSPFEQHQLQKAKLPSLQVVRKTSSKTPYHAITAKLWPFPLTDRKTDKQTNKQTN
mmetsp:Transcript_10428/g.20551  ORF Transcript_10428/g.20551 Transcript_10428/m.20551 type:complete len:103 (+) Transcript_10428:128-436(+)